MQFDWSDEASRSAAVARPREREDAAMLDAVRMIVSDVRARGWEAVTEHARRIDGSEPLLLEVAPFASEAAQLLPPSALEAIALAVRHIETFHRQTLPRDLEVITYPGLSVTKEWRPIDRIGIYVPGGKAPLFSTLLMLAIPAQVAGVRERVVVTPPRPDGGLDPAVAYAASLIGVDAIWTVGGAQAIAALAFGAGDITAVDRICGPGNRWVSAAKSLVASLPGGPGIDLPAGPSELMVIADDCADPVTVAADLLSQAEHDSEAQVILVSPSGCLLGKVASAFDAQAEAIGGTFAPARFILCGNIEEAVAIANAYGPEHLALACESADALIPAIRNAGAIFVGHHAAESFGDYLAGSSHVLPTDGAARFSSGVSTLTFMKAITVQRVSERAAATLAAPAAALARLEGLEAHARAAEARRAA